MNQLVCNGVKLGIITMADSLEDAVEELENRLAAMGIEAEISGMMSLYDEANRLLEEC